MLIRATRLFVVHRIFVNESNMSQSQLYYIHDPMCSWCWGFRPVMNQLIPSLPDSIQLIYLLGGLAPDSDEVMPLKTREYVINTWKRIQQQIPGTEFNDAFWQVCTPKRSTYPACRAVIAARQQGKVYERSMIEAIQSAYYKEAMNPSEKDVLCELASRLGLDVKQFTTDLESVNVQNRLMHEIQHSRELGGTSFPSLILVSEAGLLNITVNYLDHQPMLEKILMHSEHA